MKSSKGISASVISRLPRYYRFLCELSKNEVVRISSQELAERMGLTASQIRQDFNCFGEFGQQGYGYNVDQLKKEMAGILRLNTPKTAVLIGAGNLGRPVANGMRFEELGFQLTAIFDTAPELVGRDIRGVPILDAATLSDHCRRTHPKIAVLCLPADKARQTVELLRAAGINSFWNLSHYDIHRDYPDALVTTVHLSDSLMTLSYIINNSEER